MPASKEKKEAFLCRYRTSYAVRMLEEMKAMYEEYKQEKRPYFFYQWYLPRLFLDPFFGMGDGEDYRGILVYHETGVGKTRTAANIAAQFLKTRDVILFMPKALQSNFVGTMKRVLQDNRSPTLVGSQVRLITMDAYNAADQMKTVGSLDGKVLVIDEAHNFFKGVIGSSSDETNARKIYNLIMRAKDLKLVFCTATPITKDPFELVPCFNMLAGREILPVDYETFYNLYTREEMVKNRGKLQNRLFGYVSHISYSLRTYPEDTLDRGKARQDGKFPEDLGNTVVEVEMGHEQYSRYLLVREQEDVQKAKEMQKKKEARPLSLPSSDKGSVYYVESRMISNFSAAPEYREMEPSAMPDKAFTPEASPKIAAMLAEIRKGTGNCVIFSHFTGIGGLAVVARYLEQEGYEEMKEFKAMIPGKRFAMFSGETSDEDRNAIKTLFSSRENKNGDFLSVLLLSQVGAEGISLRNARSIHILEPYWYWSRIEQVRARVIRLGSHDDLPIDQRDVRTFIYISTCNKKIYDGLLKKEERSIDQKLLDGSMRRHRIISQFLTMLKEISIECAVNDYPGCRMCKPTGNKLYSHPGDAALDLSLRDPCETIASSEMEAEEITLEDGSKFYYVPDKGSLQGYRIFRYDEDMKGYVEVPQSSRDYLRAIAAIKASRPRSRGRKRENISWNI